MKTFTKENFDNLKLICERIISISNENIDGNLMYAQLICLADNIKDFAENPIVKNSGIIHYNEHELSNDKDCERQLKNNFEQDWRIGKYYITENFEVVQYRQHVVGKGKNHEDAVRLLREWIK